MEKETETKDQNNKLDEKESQPAVSNNRTEESCSNKEKQIMSKSIGTQDVPCDIKGVLVHVQLSHITCLILECFVDVCVISNLFSPALSLLLWVYDKFMLNFISFEQNIQYILQILHSQHCNY